MIDETMDKRLRRLLDLFLEENTKLNLSAFRSEDDCWHGNVLDSVAALELPVFKELNTPPSPALPPEGEGGKKKKPINKKLLFNAKTMRKEPTHAEEVLWEHLRDNQLGAYFRRQHPIDGKILDFYCHDSNLGVEVDGPIHNVIEEQEWDKEREEHLQSLGIRIIRFKNEDVLNNIENVFSQIETAIKHSPPPSGEGLGVGENKTEEGLEVGQNNNKKILDIGTGGGFPLLPLALCLPNCKHTGIDSTQKKIDATRRIVDAMALTNVELICGRAEELGRSTQHREQYDVVTARALASLNTLLEYASPFVKPGGKIICWKSMQVEQELQDSLLARAELSCQLIEQHRYTLPDKWGERQFLVFEKRGPINKKYPRLTGVPKKNPLL